MIAPLLLLLLLSSLHSALAFLPMPGGDSATTYPRCNCTSDCYDPPTISMGCDDQCATCYGSPCEILPGSVIPRCATCPAGKLHSVYGTAPYSCISDCESAGFYERTSSDCGLCSDFDGSSSACEAQAGCMWTHNFGSSQGAGCASSTLMSGSSSRVSRPRWPAAALATLAMSAAAAL